MSARGWQRLPESVRAAVEKSWSPCQPPSRITGANSASVFRLEAKDERLIVKATKPDTIAATRAVREQHVLASCPGPLMPVLRQRTTVDGWPLTVLDNAPLRRANLRPGSKDVEICAGMLAELGAWSAGAKVTGPVPIESDLKERRSDGLRMLAEGGVHSNGRDQALLRAALMRFDLARAAGDALTHGDPTTHHLLLSQQKGLLVDWTAAMLAAPWVDAVWFGLHLVEFGHMPDRAERVLARAIPAWRAAPPRSVDGLIALRALTLPPGMGTRPLERFSTMSALEAGAVWLRYRRKIG